MPQQTINPMQVVIQNGAITANHDHSLNIETSNNFKNGRLKLYS